MYIAAVLDSFEILGVWVGFLSDLVAVLLTFSRTNKRDNDKARQVTTSIRPSTLAGAKEFTADNRNRSWSSSLNKGAFAEEVRIWRSDLQ